MKAPDIGYIRARSLDEALDLLHRHGPDAMIIAGGQSLVPALNMRLAAPDMLVDIGAIEELRTIRLEGEGDAARLHIGALVRHAEIERSGDIARHAPLLTRAIRHVAHAAIRNRGTFGGSLANADPAAELPACALALDARMHIAGREGRRIVAAAEFFQGLYETALAPGEILCGVEIDTIGDGVRCGFAELARRSGDYAMVGLAMQGRPKPGRTLVERVSAAFFAVADRPVLARTAMAILSDASVADPDRVRLAQEALAEDLDPPSTPSVSAGTCLHLARVLLGRVVDELMDANQPRVSRVS